MNDRDHYVNMSDNFVSFLSKRAKYRLTFSLTHAFFARQRVDNCQIQLFAGVVKGRKEEGERERE